MKYRGKPTSKHIPKHMIQPDAKAPLCPSARSLGWRASAVHLYMAGGRPGKTWRTIKRWRPTRRTCFGDIPKMFFILFYFFKGEWVIFGEWKTGGSTFQSML